MHADKNSYKKLHVNFDIFRCYQFKSTFITRISLLLCGGKGQSGLYFGCCLFLRRAWRLCTGVSGKFYNRILIQYNSTIEFYNRRSCNQPPCSNDTMKLITFQTSKSQYVLETKSQDFSRDTSTKIKYRI